MFLLKNSATDSSTVFFSKLNVFENPMNDFRIVNFAS